MFNPEKVSLFLVCYENAHSCWCLPREFADGHRNHVFLCLASMVVCLVLGCCSKSGFVWIRSLSCVAAWFALSFGVMKYYLKPFGPWPHFFDFQPNNSNIPTVKGGCVVFNLLALQPLPLIRDSSRPSNWSTHHQSQQPKNNHAQGPLRYEYSLGLF